MARVLLYNNMQSMVRNVPVRLPRKTRSRRKSVLWVRDRFLLDRGIEMKKRPKAESMVACFDPPKGVEIANPFPEEFFIPGRTIFMAGTISMEVANVVKDKLFERASQDPDKPIILWIDSPGGSVEAGLLIKEVMEAIKPAVSTIAIGGVSSMAALLSAFGSKGYRYVLEAASLMYHEVRYAQTLAGSADEMEEAAQGLIESTDRLFSLLAAASGNTLAAIKESVGARDRFFGAEDAVRAGFMDGVLRPVRYYGPANPWGWKIDTPRSPLQRTGKRVLQLGEKIEPRPAAATLTLRGELEEMRAYQIIGQLVSHIALYPDRNVKLEITNSPGGIIDGGLGIFDVMRLINALPNCGNVTTLGRGNSIEGMSALLLAGGKLGNRDIYPEATMVLGDIQVAAAPYTPATRVLEASEEAARISDLLLDGFGRHSGLSPVAIRESIAGGEEGGRFEMLPEEAVGHRFVDRLIG